MSDIESLLGYAGQLSEAAQQSKAAAAQQHQYINGDDRTDVETESGPVPTLAKQVRVYFESIPDAVSQLSSQMADGRLHDTELLGRQAVTDGVYFYVKSNDPLISRLLYKRIDANTSQFIVADASEKAVRDIRDRMKENGALVFGVGDTAGLIGFEVRTDSIRTSELEVSAERLKMGDQQLIRNDNYSLAVTDPFGFIGFKVGLGDEAGGGDDAAGAFTATEITKANAKGLMSSASVVREFNTEVARPIWDYNHIEEYGQSLSTAFEGWPALSKTSRFGNLMLGDSVRPASRTAGAFTPVGGAALRPLKSVVQDFDSPGTILTDEQVAALAPGAGNEGEAVVIGMTNMAKKLHNQLFQTLNDQARVFVASCCGVAGQPIERLMKGDSTNRWLRLTQAAQQVKDIATTEGKSYGLVGVLFLQGEFNYSTNWDGVATKAEYKQKLATLYSDLEADVVSGIAGQQPPPLFLTYQTGASYTRDENDLAIGMAQWELSEERDNWVMATPVYPYPDKGGHLTSNGYRWVSKQFAKVWHRVVEQGQNWKPLSPLSAQVRGKEALITFHVPHPPLAFDKPCVGRVLTDYATKGFSAVDAGGALPVASVAIVADCVVRLAFGRDPEGPVYIRYADKAIHNGNGCLRDSDPTISDDVYEYVAGSGQYADENIPSLVGKPYPLHNWCIAFHIPATGV